MTRHAKNNTASSVYSYHERQRDTIQSGYGTQRQRLGKDSIKDFNACNLTLQPCRIAVVTPQGYLFDKEAILSYIVKQKVENARKLKKYEKERLREQRELEELAKKQNEEQVQQLMQQEVKVIVDKTGQDSKNASTSNSVSNMSKEKEKQLPSFWVPNLTPSTSKDKVKKPSLHVLCPMSGQILKSSQLIPVTFTPCDPKCTDPKKATYKCAVTHDVLTNTTKCVVLRTSGSVVTQDCVDRIIRKDMIDPINGKKMVESDLIPLQRGGTGYADSNQLEARVKKPVMMA